MSEQRKEETLRERKYYKCSKCGEGRVRYLYGNEQLEEPPIGPCCDPIWVERDDE